MDRSGVSNIVIVLPTYNEAENVKEAINRIFNQHKVLKPPYLLSILVVDDNSPDGTGNIVTKLQQIYPNLHLITGKKKGLGAAYIRGFKYALKNLSPDILFEMDADLSHDPNLIPKFIGKIEDGADFVIGSRYIKGGSIPKDWGLMRKLNSKFGNLFATYVAGLEGVKDTTSGYRAIKANILRDIDLDSIQTAGYVFQIKILYLAQKAGAKVAEVPLKFKDREKGSSKLRIVDVLEFIETAFFLRWDSFKLILYDVLLIFIPIVTLIWVTNYILFSSYFSSTSQRFISYIIFLISIILTLQGVFTLIWMLYAWENPQKVKKHSSPKTFDKPKYSFTAVVPALHEEGVIKSTINAINNIDYPAELKEILVINRIDDVQTIKATKEIISEIHSNNIKLLIPEYTPKNKPDKLNYALNYATNEVLVIFDAEDEPHKDIYNIVNTIMIEENSDVVQSGIQLMNYKSSWFSTLNVLEYFFWFKSALHFFTSNGITPLGGNTVFFKKDFIKSIGGWDINCLTEDADLGIRLTLKGAKIRIVYDERHVTKEETPPTIISFIKQRTRWNQGFMQILMKGDWAKLPTVKQKFLTGYILFAPILQALLLLYMPIAIYLAFTQKVPIIISIISFIPIFTLFLQILSNTIGLYEFTKLYKLKWGIFDTLKVLLFFFPYQALLMFSSFRALYRTSFNLTGWEKTTHLNAHRSISNWSLIQND